MFIALDVTALVYVQIMNMRETRPWETYWTVISSEETTDQARFGSWFVYFRSCFENVHKRRSRDIVYANSGSIPRLEKAIWNIKTMSKY